jgi:hypothetical protein
MKKDHTTGAIQIQTCRLYNYKPFCFGNLVLGSIGITGRTPFFYIFSAVICFFAIRTYTYTFRGLLPGLRDTNGPDIIRRTVRGRTSTLQENNLTKQAYKYIYFSTESPGKITKVHRMKHYRQTFVFLTTT